MGSGKAGYESDTLLDQHRRLREALSRIEEAVDAAPAAPSAGRWVVKLALDLDELQGRLAAHFAHEEESGLFRTIVDERPEASSLCERLAAQHEEFLSRLSRLRQDARGSGAGALSGFVTGVRMLVDELRRHEMIENELVVESLEPSVAAQD